MTQGEKIDSLPIEQIILMDNFVSLTVVDGFGDMPDYWEITLKSIYRDGKLYTIFDTEVNHRFHKFFKTKSLKTTTT